MHDPGSAVTGIPAPAAGIGTRRAAVEPIKIPLVFTLVKVIGCLLIVTLYRFRARGVRHIPKGPVLLASNHETYLDPLLSGMAVGRPVHFMGRSTLFRNPVFGIFLASCHTIPINRERGDVKGVKIILDHLRAGDVVVIYPEGTRTRTGAPGTFRPGIGSLAAKANVPVVPTLIEGAFGIWPPGRSLPSLRGRIRVSYGPALRVAPGEAPEVFARRLEDAVNALRTEGQPGNNQRPTTNHQQTPNFQPPTPLRRLGS